jgi:diguanylate cyclase (GGDEF)-like protein
MQATTSVRIESLCKIAAAFTSLRSLDRVGEIVRDAALELVGSDGASVLLPEGDGCCFPRHSALALARSERSKLESSAGGWAMRNRCPAIIPDVAHDPRTPFAVYGPTLIESVAAVPILQGGQGGQGGTSPSLPPGLVGQSSAGLPAPRSPREDSPVALGAIENYWIERHVASKEEIEMLQLLAELTALGLRSVHLCAELESRVQARTADLEQLSRQLLDEAEQRRRSEEEARRLACTDELTGLYNRRGLFSLGGPLLVQGRKSSWPICVLYADVDGLKRINDTQGHEAGDRAIQAAARALKGALRETDLVARVGGDEFCAVLTGSQGDGSALLARLSRLAKADPSSGRPAMSVGLARDDGAMGTDLDRLVQRADHVMYALKRWRRERTFAPNRETLRLWAPASSSAD